MSGGSQSYHEQEKAEEIDYMARRIRKNVEEMSDDYLVSLVRSLGRHTSDIEKNVTGTKDIFTKLNMLRKSILCFHKPN